MNAGLIPESVAEVMDRLRQSVDEGSLSYAARLKVALAVHQMIVPKRKRGKRRDERLDSAYADYRAKVRGLKLFRKHIPGHDKLSHWRRSVEERRLMAALQKRASRNTRKKRQQRARRTEQAPWCPVRPP